VEISGADKKNTNDETKIVLPSPYLQWNTVF
jgi:hypothetical protein